MPIQPFHFLLLFAAALIAGAINSVAGGGTLLTFPALLAVLGPGGAILANGTSTVALVPGSISAVLGYRSEMGHSRRDLIAMGIPSLLGGALGAFLAVHAGAALFSRLVPWLIFAATLLFLIQDPVRRWIGKGEGEKSASPLGLGGMLIQFCVAIYGGFFGAGIGIMMLAALGFLGQTNIHRMNGLKNFAAVCINGVAALTFILNREVNWTLALMMAVAAMIGGYGGAGMARRVGQANVRRVVIAVGLSFGVYTLYGQLRG